jgi:hypothetical protein
MNALFLLVNYKLPKRQKFDKILHMRFHYLNFIYLIFKKTLISLNFQHIGILVVNFLYNLMKYSIFL